LERRRRQNLRRYLNIYQIDRQHLCMQMTEPPRLPLKHCLR
jgi:hypothetical protein